MACSLLFKGAKITWGDMHLLFTSHILKYPLNPPVKIKPEIKLKGAPFQGGKTHLHIHISYYLSILVPSNTSVTQK